MNDSRFPSLPFITFALLGWMCWDLGRTGILPDALQTAAYSFQPTDDNSPIARYLWLWIKWVCYTLGGVAGATGLVFGIFGFWVGRGPIIKQGLISAVAGFAFVLVIPFVRIVFGEWVNYREDPVYLPEPTAALLEGVQQGWALLQGLGG